MKILKCFNIIKNTRLQIDGNFNKSPTQISYFCENNTWKLLSDYNIILFKACREIKFIVKSKIKYLFGMINKYCLESSIFCHFELCF